MELRTDEQIIASIRRHKTPFAFAMVKLLIVFLPFYFLAYFIGREFGDLVIFISLLMVSAFLGFFAAYISLMYFLDKLVITNQRVISVDWHSLFIKEECEAELADIQDIRTREAGFLSKFKIFDYGMLEIETASSSTVIRFNNSPNPEGIQDFIFTHRKKHIAPRT